MAKSKGRPSTYKEGKVLPEPLYNEKSHPEQLLTMMGAGLLDCQIIAALDLKKDTFYRWLREHEDFKDAYERGLPKCEAKYVAKMLESIDQKDDGGFKYYIALMNNKFDWNKDEGKTVNNTQININNSQITSYRDMTPAQLLDHVQEKMIDTKIIDVIPELIEVSNESRNSTDEK
jgi:hypothetical protein